MWKTQIGKNHSEIQLTLYNNYFTMNKASFQKEITEPDLQIEAHNLRQETKEDLLNWRSLLQRKI